MGFGGTTSITDVIFDRNQYYTGDLCQVKIICDNSQCTVGIKSFKIKLKRKIFAIGEHVSAYGPGESRILKTSKYLYQYKDVNTGCGPRQKVEKILKFTIPVTDPDLPNDNLKLKFNDLELPIVKNLTASINGNLIQVFYSIKIFIKH